MTRLNEPFPARPDSAIDTTSGKMRRYISTHYTIRSMISSIANDRVHFLSLRCFRLAAIFIRCSLKNKDEYLTLQR